MDKNRYILKALRTEFKDFKPIAKRLKDKDMLRIVHALLGLSGEVGELIDIFKGHIFYGKPIDWNHVIEEMGDLEWYTAPIYTIAGKKLGLDLPAEKAMRLNIRKLMVRYPDAFSESHATIRNLTKEAKVLGKGLTSAIKRNKQVRAKPKIKRRAVKVAYLTYPYTSVLPGDPQ